MVELERHQAAPAAYYVKTENKMYSRMWIVNRIRPAHSQQTDQHVAELFQKHKKLLQGTGNLTEVDKLETDETLRPVAQPARQIHSTAWSTK